VNIPSLLRDMVAVSGEDFNPENNKYHLVAEQ
jgi:hypothetical protein